MAQDWFNLWVRLLKQGTSAQHYLGRRPGIPSFSGLDCKDMKTPTKVRCPETLAQLQERCGLWPDLVFVVPCPAHLAGFYEERVRIAVGTPVETRALVEAFNASHDKLHPDRTIKRHVPPHYREFVVAGEALLQKIRRAFVEGRLVDATRLLALASPVWLILGPSEEVRFEKWGFGLEVQVPLPNRMKDSE